MNGTDWPHMPQMMSQMNMMPWPATMSDMASTQGIPAMPTLGHPVMPPKPHTGRVLVLPGPQRSLPSYSVPLPNDCGGLLHALSGGYGDAGGLYNGYEIRNDAATKILEAIQEKEGRLVKSVNSSGTRELPSLRTLEDSWLTSTYLLTALMTPLNREIRKVCNILRGSNGDSRKEEILISLCGDENVRASIELMLTVSQILLKWTKIWSHIIIHRARVANANVFGTSKCPKNAADGAPDTNNNNNPALNIDDKRVYDKDVYRSSNEKGLLNMCHTAPPSSYPSTQKVQYNPYSGLFKPSSSDTRLNVVPDVPTWALVEAAGYGYDIRSMQRTPYMDRVVRFSRLLPELLSTAYEAIALCNWYLSQNPTFYQSITGLNGWGGLISAAQSPNPTPNLASISPTRDHTVSDMAASFVATQPVPTPLSVNTQTNYIASSLSSGMAVARNSNNKTGKEDSAPSTISHTSGDNSVAIDQKSFLSIVTQLYATAFSATKMCAMLDVNVFDEVNHYIRDIHANGDSPFPPVIAVCGTSLYDALTELDIDLSNPNDPYRAEYLAHVITNILSGYAIFISRCWPHATPSVSQVRTRLLSALCPSCSEGVQCGCINAQTNAAYFGIPIETDSVLHVLLIFLMYRHHLYAIPNTQLVRRMYITMICAIFASSVVVSKAQPFTQNTSSQGEGRGEMTYSISQVGRLAQVSHKHTDIQFLSNSLCSDIMSESDVFRDLVIQPDIQQIIAEVAKMGNGSLSDMVDQGVGGGGSGNDVNGGAEEGYLRY